MLWQAPSVGDPALNKDSAPQSGFEATSSEASVAVESGDTAPQQPENSRRAQAAADEAFARVAAAFAPRK